MVPPGGYTFLVTEPEEMVLEDYTFKKLLTTVANHYRSNNIPIPADLEQQIINQICATSPVGFCKAQSEGLGDTLHTVFKITGVQKMAAKRAGNAKGICSSCSGRQKKLNKLVPYRW